MRMRNTKKKIWTGCIAAILFLLAVSVSIVGSDLAHYLFGYFVAAVSFAVRSSHRSLNSTPAFLIAVALIILICSKKQMVWPHANAIIAAMKHPEAIWDNSKVKYPGEAMGGHSFVAAIAQRADQVRWIVARICAIAVYPTTFCLSDILPESFHWRDCASTVFLADSWSMRAVRALPATKLRFFSTGFKHALTA